MMENTKVKKILMVVIPLILALVMIFGISKPMTSTEFHKHTIDSLDEKQETVLKLTAASTAASVAISAIPSDLGTPIAEKMADMSSYFLIVLCAIFLEKYMVTMVGYATFVVLLPLACVLFAGNVFWKKEFVTRMVLKLAMFGIAISLVIPASVGVSNMIENTYKQSIDSTVSSAEGLTKDMGEDESDTKNQSWIDNLTSKISSKVTDAVDKLETMFNNFIEALAVMIGTSSIIPILVLLFFIWLIKVLLGVEINLPTHHKKRHHVSSKPAAIE